MRVSSTSRAIAALIAVAAGVAGPSTALAHGLEHARAGRMPVRDAHASTDSIHHHDHAGDTDDSRAVASPRSDDHAHPRVEAGPTGRASLWLPVVVPVSAAILIDARPVAVAPIVRDEDVPRSGTTDPPPKLRAPPIR